MTKGIGMDIALLSKKYLVRRLDVNDVDIVYNMSCKNEIFYQYHPPFVTKQRIIEDMEALPPHKTYDDKYYIGFFDNNILVAYMDLILGFPTQEVAFIGLLMTNALYQNRGVGSGIVRDVCTYLRELGYKKVRIGVDKENPQSYSFWYKNGFRIISEKEYNVMELVI